ncbi:MAG: HEAT repeat domain-containing protein [Deltaproteobacteria bacterium]|nr:HEAT repeat domain-containing protein [Deltaproteobacteria bacterium]
MRTIAFIVVLFLSIAARAEESVKLIDGARVSLKKGRVKLHMDGKVTWSFTLPKATPDGAASLKKYDLGDERTAVHARVVIGKSKSTEAVFLRKGHEKSFKPVWKEITGLKGDIGERLGKQVRFDDLNGDGLPDIATGLVLESVHLCGIKELPLLFRKVFDPKTEKFRSVLARRPSLDKAVNIDGSNDPGDGPTVPLIRQAQPSSASRAAGDRGEPLLLAPPAVIADDNPATAWIPIPGNGAGEFASLEMLVQVYGLTRIGIRSLPAGVRPEKYDRPRSLLLVTENNVYRLEFPADPLLQPDRTTWFDLPKAEQTSCLSIVVEKSYAPSPRRPMSIAEVVVLTEADGPEGLTRLARDLSDSHLRRQAAMLLERAGEEAVPAIRNVWGSLDWQGRQRAVNVIARAGPEAGADLLAEAAINGDPALLKGALMGLHAAGDAAVPPLTRFLESTVESRFETAVEMLASLDMKSALDALVAVVGKGGRDRRALLRKRIGFAARRTSVQGEGIWSHITRAQEKDENERLLDLLRAAVGLPGLAQRLAELVGGLLDQVEEFADRYRLLDVMGRLECDASLAHLEAAAADPDHIIRTVAVTGLGRCADESEERRRLITQALEDDAPQVRLAALGAIEKTDEAAAAAEKLGMLAEVDPWPGVRALSVQTARKLPVELAVPILEQTAVDRSSRVRAAAIEAAARVPGDRVDRIIIARLEDKNEQPGLKKLAAGTAGARCQESALGALFEVLKTGAEPLADEKNVSAAVAAAKAIGAVGGENAKKLLEKAKRRSNPATDRAIDAALAALGKPCN